MQDPDRLQFVYKGRNVSFDGTNEFVDSKKAVIVKATLFSDDEKQTKEIWIKLSRVADSPRVADQESKLFEALAASKKPEPIKPNVQVVQLDMDFKAEVTDNKKICSSPC